MTLLRTIIDTNFYHDTIEIQDQINTSIYIISNELSSDTKTNYPIGD